MVREESNKGRRADALAHGGDESLVETNIDSYGMQTMIAEEKLSPIAPMVPRYNVGE